MILRFLIANIVISTLAIQLAFAKTSEAPVKATPKAVLQLVKWETESNQVAVRSSEAFDLLHYEIPLNLLEKDIADYTPEALLGSLIFKKDGKSYARWIINPEDTKMHLELKKYFKKKNLILKPKKFFRGYLTASRSVIAVNPETGFSFSVKVSTNNTGGHWKDKKQTWTDAKQIRKMSDWVTEISASVKKDFMLIMDEPFALGVKGIDQGLVVRSLNDVAEDAVYYLPGFSALHTEIGVKIAKKNGDKNPVKFWNKHYNKPLARALAEFTVATGASYDSPHSQNFLIELDRKLKPTGRIVLRDFGDIYVLTDFVKRTEHADLLKIWEADNLVSGELRQYIGLLHGNDPPTWMTIEDYKKWSRDFFQQFEQKFSELSRIPIEDLKETRASHSDDFSYSSKVYQTSSDRWKRFLIYANCFSGNLTTLDQKECLKHFLQKHKFNSCNSYFHPVNGKIH